MKSQLNRETYPKEDNDYEDTVHRPALVDEEQVSNLTTSERWNHTMGWTELLTVT